MLWIKTFHLVFMVSWFAVLFMLPRLFVYHLETDDPAMRAKFSYWQKRTYTLGHTAFGLMLICGLALLWINLQASSLYFKQGWLHAKLAMVAVLFGYFIYCGVLQKQLARGECKKSSRWMRLFNEVPALFLIAIIALVVTKPF